MKEHIARFGHGSAKLARQAQSKEVLEKMVAKGLTENVEAEAVVWIKFENVDANKLQTQLPECFERAELPHTSVEVCSHWLAAACICCISLYLFVALTVLLRCVFFTTFWLCGISLYLFVAGNDTRNATSCSFSCSASHTC
jgi:hypothetical protein